MKCSTKNLIFATTVLLSCLTFIFFSGQYKFPKSENYLWINVNLTKILSETDEKFLSVGLDLSFVKCGFHQFNESAWKKLEEITSVLSPGFLRLGGTAADQVIFVLNDKFEHEMENIENCSSEVLQHDLLKITDKDWIKINNFVIKTNLNFIFDLNVLLRSSDGWNSSNAQMILKFSEEKKFLIDFQLGNEPNYFHHVFNVTVSGKELGKDFNHLRRLLNSYHIYKNSKLIGPDVTKPKHLGTDSLKYLDEFLSETNSIDAVSWHQYYLNGKVAQLQDFINPETFNILHQQINAITKIVRKYSSNLPIWISETGSAYGGGAPNLSDRFVASFLWLDKLGISAASGIKIIIRQSLFKGNYALVDPELVPNPDFWISLIYKKLVGAKVLEVTFNKSSSKNHLRFYGHCSFWNETKNQTDGKKIVIFALNFSNTTEKVVMTGIYIRYPIYSYILTPEKKNLTSKTVYLNGKKLVYNKATIKNLLKFSKKIKFPLVLPSYSIAFWVIQSVFPNICDQGCSDKT